ncbi:MAG: hypothetical protein QN125_08585 [Armatimonadota bacterium]|nr:hypothetical protein [Armatimonadota bacterium]
MSQQETQHLMVLNALERGELIVTDAATLLDRSVRQTQRLRAAYRARGPAGLVHGNRGRPSSRRLAEAIRARVIHLARTTYARVNFQHLSELLADRDGLVLSRPTLHRLLTAAGLRSPRTRRRAKHRRRRERFPQTGMLVQLDGSHHAWLEDRGPKLTLHHAVDDATGTVLGAVFRAQEDAQGYLLLLRQITRTVGLPLAVYTDRHGINTISLAPHHLQILPGPGGRSYAKARVEVHERLDSTLAVYYQGHQLDTRLLSVSTQHPLRARPHRRVHPHALPGGIPISPPRRQPRPGGTGQGGRALRQGTHASARRTWKPTPDHPWHQFAREGKRRKELREAGVTFSRNR